MVCECLHDHSNGTVVIPVLILLWYCGHDVVGGQVSCTARLYVLPLYLYHIGVQVETYVVALFRNNNMFLYDT
jgi:hypothetical protein